MQAELHVVFGAGQVGRALAQHLVTRGKAVRVVSRSGTAPAGTEGRSADALDAAAARTAATGASHIYNVLNAPYSAVQWAATFPRLQDNLIAAAGASDAKLVVLENIYMLGRPDGAPLTEQTPVRPASRKGEVRARLTEALFAAHAAGRAQVVSGRASHFVGPGVTQSTIGEVFFKAARKGGKVPVFGNLEARHSFSYVPDVAAGLAALGAAGDNVLGRAWMLPTLEAVPVRDVYARTLAAMGTGAFVKRVPSFMMRPLSWFIPILRELIEMRYEWESDYVVDSSAIRQHLGVIATPLEDALAATGRWARQAYVQGAAREVDSRQVQVHAQSKR